jgi:hypothetical protein
MHWQDAVSKYMSGGQLAVAAVQSAVDLQEQVSSSKYSPSGHSNG